MRKTSCGELSSGLCVCIAVLLVFSSVGIAQQEPMHSDSRTSKTLQSTGEFLAGVGCAVLLGFLGYRIGDAAVDPHSDDPMEPGIGVMVGSTLGSTTGVFLAGKYLKDNGSWEEAFLGALICPMLGAAIGAILAPVNPFEYKIFYGAVGGSLVSPLGATIGYALSRRPQQPMSQSLFYIEDSKIRLGIPSPMLRPVLLSTYKVTWEYQISLASIRF